MLALLNRETTASDGDVATIRVTNTQDRVLWPIWAAHDLLTTAMDLYKRRARSAWASTT